MKNILLIIDSLGSGGAQRQMVNLAVGLKENGHGVHMLVYYPQFDFYRAALRRADVEIHEVGGVDGFSWSVVVSIAKLLRSFSFDAIISFLPPANAYSVLAKVLSRSNTDLIVGERASKHADQGVFRMLIQRLSYLVATWVVTNSHDHADYLRKTCFWLRKKTHTIYNGYRVGCGTLPSANVSVFGFGFLVIGRVDPGKNGIALLRALVLFFERNRWLPMISWAGRQEADDLSLAVRERMDALIADHPVLSARWQWLGVRTDIPELLAASDGLIHVSLHEGLPNAVCEAFVAGRPVIASSVCDHPLLIGNEERGLLCDPHSPESICVAIERFVAFTADRRATMGRNARLYAAEHLSLARMVAEYEALVL